MLQASSEAQHMQWLGALRGLVEEMRLPSEDQHVLGTQGLSGWFAHGRAAVGDSSPLSMTTLYLSLRRESANAGSDGDVATTSLYVFNNAQDHRGYFAGAQADPTLVRHRLDMGDILHVRELLDESAGSRAIEMDVASSRDGSGTVTSSHVRVIQASSEGQHNQWLSALRSLVEEAAQTGSD